MKKLSIFLQKLLLYTKSLKSNKAALFILIAAATIFTNIIISYLPIRFDFSSGNAYSLSSSTKKILKSLDDVVTIKIFASSDLPIALLPLKTDVIDLATEYSRQSKGKVITKILDPKKNNSVKEDAQNMGLPELQFSQIEKDKYAVSSSYFGIVITQKDKKEIIPQATNLESLEYDITSAIYKMTQKNPARVMVFGAPVSLNTRQDPFFSLKDVLQKQFQVESLSLEEAIHSSRLDNTIKTLIVVSDNNQPFSDHDISLIDNYIKNKGTAIFMVDGVYVSDTLEVHEAAHNLFNLFKNYGLTLNKNLVLSQSAEIANFTSGNIGFFTSYPFWLKTTNFSKENTIFTNISALTFPWVSSISFKNTKKTKVILASEKQSWIVETPPALLPNEIPVPDKKIFKDYVLAAESTADNNGQIMLIGSSRFAKEQFLAPGRGNIDFLVNLISHYISGGALSGIRARSAGIYPLKEIPDASKDPFKYATILVFPIFFGLYGANRLIKRR